MTEQSKIGYSVNDSGNIDNYIFFYRDNKGNWCKVEEPIEKENTIELSKDKSSYIEKYVTIKTILNFELHESDDNYTITEETISYKIYYNQAELVKITD